MTPIPETFRGSPPDDDEPWLAYIRVSTWKEEAISPDLQRAAIRAWERRTGRRVIDWIEDLDVSGRHFNRKIMQGIERVERGEARGIVVWKFSRFGRDDTGIAINLARLEYAGGHLESATEDVDARTAVGRLNRRLLFDIAVFESDRAGEQWTEAHDLRRKHGLPATGRPRWGYVWTPRRIPDGKGGWTLQNEKYEPDPEYAELHAYLYDAYIDGHTFTELVEYLNENGHYTVNGNPWQISTLSRWMDSGWAAGLLHIHDKKACGNPKCAGRGCPHYTHIEGAHRPSIVALDKDIESARAEAKEKWEEYQKRRSTAQRMAPRALNASYSVTGLVRCGRCRGACRIASYTCKKRGISKPGYALRCLNRSHAGKSVCSGVWIRRKVVEDAIFEWLAKEAADDIDALPSTAIPQPRSAVTARADQRRALEKAKSEAESALTRLMVARAKDPDLYPDQAFAAAQAELQRDRQKAVEGLAQLEVAEQAAPTRGDMQPVMVGMLLEWESLPPSARNAILRTLIRRVAIVPVMEHGKRSTRVEVHPVWEADPWGDQGECVEDVSAALAGGR
ncbi:recombinase family protein [Streptomyces sp. enrichment culture]|uniref:recombinase family protein n=1 Tax=Streptomyces sp. enrichment culture TaxID=1795815 RepID=UPI003F54F18B